MEPVRKVNTPSSLEVPPAHHQHQHHHLPSRLISNLYNCGAVIHNSLVGRFRSDLSDAARQIVTSTPSSSTEEQQQPPSQKKRRTKTVPPRSGYVPPPCSDDEEAFERRFCHKLSKRFPCFKKWRNTIAIFTEDWFFLAALGIVMAFCSFAMDFVIEKLQHGHTLIYNETERIHWTVQYLTYVMYTVILVGLTTFIVKLIAPQAIGSGIPEMKTILRGVVLKEYLTPRTLLSKSLGLTLSLGAGMPIGKEGPFVHVASIVATLLSQLVTTFKGIYENESRNSEMLAAACAVGVACTFGAPVGGVLFSIEVTSVYFAVRNYWRGFFAAACSATVFRLLNVIFKDDVTVRAFYSTSFPGEAPFYPEELVPFALIGVACGFGGALFIYTHRTIVVFLRRNKYAKRLLKTSVFIYPMVIALLVASLMFPLGFGKYSAGEQTFRKAINDLFVNFSWTQHIGNNSEHQKVIDIWQRGTGSVFTSLTLYCITTFFLSALSNTLPIPAGVFIPVFVIGASFGRLIGECMATWFPHGLRGVSSHLIIPGGYAVVGAAAFCGSATHTVSVSVIVFELTGQLVYILPVMIAVLIANGICAYLQPSIYDSMIKIKHLPYLPDIPPASSVVHGILAEHIMVRDVKFISRKTTYRDMQDLLINYPKLRSFPIVDSDRTMLLLGSGRRKELIRLLNRHVGHSARKLEALRRQNDPSSDSDTQLTETAPALAAAASAFFATSAAAAGVTADGLKAMPLHKKQSLPDLRLVSDDDGSDHPPRARFTVSKVASPAPAAGDESSSDSAKAADETTKMKVEKKPFNDSDSALDTTGSRRRVQISTGSPTVFNKRPSEPAVNSHRLFEPPNNSKLSSALSSHYNSVTNSLLSMSSHLFKKSGGHHAGGWKPSPDEVDLYGDERRQWEADRLDASVPFDQLQIDAAPFQLVERTSLYKVHSLFSLLGMNRAYVTNCGRLVGVVALREVRAALECASSGVLTPQNVSTSSEFAAAASVAEAYKLEASLAPRLHRSDSSGANLELPMITLDRADSVKSNKSPSSSRTASEDEDDDKEPTGDNVEEGLTFAVAPVQKTWSTVTNPDPRDRSDTSFIY